MNKGFGGQDRAPFFDPTVAMLVGDAFNARQGLRRPCGGRNTRLLDDTLTMNLHHPLTELVSGRPPATISRDENLRAKSGGGRPVCQRGTGSHEP
jgi:hypothetical protein